MSSLEHLLDRNRRWSRDIRAREPDFFQRLTAQQNPSYLWIGCSDSRVPANEIVDLLPGDSSSIATSPTSSCTPTSTACRCCSTRWTSLHVEHVIVVGHYGCGGIRAALANNPLGLIDNWLRHVQDVAERHSEILDPLDEHARVDRLCELNVVEQVHHVARTTIVQDAWQRGQPLTLHGWVYGISDGLVKDLRIEADSATRLDADYKAALADVARSGR